jgi:hypothetical protein
VQYFVPQENPHYINNIIIIIITTRYQPDDYISFWADVVNDKSACDRFVGGLCDLLDGSGSSEYNSAIENVNNAPVV